MHDLLIIWVILFTLQHNIIEEICSFAECGIASKYFFLSFLFTWYQSLHHTIEIMSTSSSIFNSTAAATSSSMGILPTPSLGHLINVKLTRTNYLLWKAQFLSYLRSQQLLGYVDGTIVAPEKMITQATTEGATQTPNPAYQ